MIFSRNRALDRDNALCRTLRKWPRTSLGVLALGVALLIGSSPAEASQSPPACTNNGVSLDLRKGASGSIVSGQIVTYTVVLENGVFPSCDAGTIVIQGFCPDLSGNPTILTKTFPPIPSLTVPTPAFTVGTFDCAVTVNPGVNAAQAKDTISGVLHDNIFQDDPFSVSKTVSVGILTQGMSVTANCQFATASMVNYSGTVSNIGTDVLVNLQCTNDQGGSLNLGATTIPPGGQVTYSGSFNATSPSINRVTCVATAQSAQIQVGPEWANASCAFANTPPPTNQIPTLSEWGMILLAMLLVTWGVTTLRMS